MSDTFQHNTGAVDGHPRAQDADEEKVPVSDEKITPDYPKVAAPKNAILSDDDLEPREATVKVVKEEQPAQVTGPAAEPVDTVNVHEVSVQLDEVITDPSSPLAVQIPDAGRGDLSLPIHGLNGPTVEQFFAENATDADERSEEEAFEAKKDS